MANKFYIITLCIFLLVGCETKETRTKYFPSIEQKTNDIPSKENVWVFILAGQSNMAGRGIVEPMDTIPNLKILTINKKEDIIIAKEPLHFYQPTLTGLDCGLSFGKELLKHIPDSISLLIIPAAVGGSSINQWINDEIFRNVKLFSNFKAKVAIGKRHGTIKGILWHQGEIDATTQLTIETYDKQLQNLFNLFRNELAIDELPILIGELGSFSKTKDNWSAINSKIEDYIAIDSFAHLIKTDDLRHIGDSLHFDSEAQRKIGKRFAEKFVEVEINRP